MHNEGQPKQHLSRRKFLIYPRFQWTLILVNSAIIFAAAIFVAAVTKLSFDQLIDMGKQAQLPENHSYYMFVNFQKQHLYSNLKIALVASLFLSFFVTLILSHKISGPLVRLRNYFQEASNTGELNKIEFRKGDFIYDLSKVMNQAFEKVKSNKKKTAA